MRIVPIPQLMDNYAYLVIDEATNEAGIVDCAEAGPVLEAVEREGVRLGTILPTHHHFDHVGGNEDLLKQLKLEVIGYAGQAHRIPGCTREVREGDLKSACQQACPAHAIAFGDLNNPESEISRWSKRDRQYALLAEIGTRPRTRFLGKVRNPNPEMKS